MDALFQTQSNELSTTTQKEKLFKDAERQWNTLSTEKGAPGRKVDFEIYKSILYNLEIRKVYLDSKLSLEKFSSIVGTNTTYLSNAVNNYFGCNFKQLLNKYRVEYAKPHFLKRELAEYVPSSNKDFAYSTRYLLRSCLKLHPK